MTTPDSPPEPTPTSRGTNGSTPPASKLAEALGFGSAPASGAVLPPSGPYREPKKAFQTARRKLEGTAIFDAGPRATAPTGKPAVAAAPATPEAVVASAVGVPAASPPRSTEGVDAGGGAPVPAARVVSVPGGPFLYGESKRAASVPAFEIDRDPVTHADYERFVRATGHRPPLYWKDGSCPPELREHPVVGVDYYDAMAYARWVGKDLPFEDEWERAARGTDGRTYPWGEDADPASNTARTGLRMTVPVGFYDANVSPDGCRDMVGNAWELTHSPAPGGGVVVRGGSWYDFVLYAKTYFRFATRVDARNGTIGFRCVERSAPRTDAARAIRESDLDAAIAARRGPGEKVDPATWTADRRDLVLDARRLRQAVVQRDVDRAEAAPARPVVKRAFGAPVVPATTPPSPAAPAASAAVRPSPPRPASSAPPPFAARPPAAPPPAPLPPRVVFAGNRAVASPDPAAPATPAAPTSGSGAAAPATDAAKRAPERPAAPGRKPTEPTPKPQGPPVPSKPSVPEPPNPPAPRPAEPLPKPKGPPVPSTPAIPEPQRPRRDPMPRPQGPPVPAPNQPQGALSAAAASAATTSFAATPASPKGSPAASADDAAAPGEAPGDESHEPSEPRSAEEPSSPLRLALLSMAFLAASVLVIVLLVSHSRGASDASSAEEVAGRLGLPLPAAVDEDAAPPRIAVVDVAATTAPAGMLVALAHGATIAIFAKPGTPSGDANAALAADLHRRLRGHAVRVVLVVPREAVARDAGDPLAAAREAVERAKVRGDLTVALDPDSAFRRAHGLPGDEAVAVLLEDGDEVLRASPADADGSLRLEHVAPLVSEAQRRHAAATPPATLAPR